MESRQPRSRIEKIRIDTLRVPPAGKAQRPFRESRGHKIAAEFEINSFGFPVICQVEGSNWVVDGQHRVYAIQKCGYAKATDLIDCEVYQGLTMAEMARMFLGRNRSTPVTAFERFGVAVTAGYPAERAITEIVGGCRAEDRIPGDGGERLLGGGTAAGVRPVRSKDPGAGPASPARRVQQTARPAWAGN